MELRDKNYIEVKIGMGVLVPEPDSTLDDCWNNEFEGTIIKLDSTNGYVIVEDMEGDCFTIEVERVEVL